MALFASSSERKLAEAISKLAFCNPFSRERMEAEKQVLGREPSEKHPELYREVWAGHFIHPDIQAISDRATDLAETLWGRIKQGEMTPADKELRLFEDVVLYHLYSPHRVEFDQIIDRIVKRKTAGLEPLWNQFQLSFRKFFQGQDTTVHSGIPVEHLFALFFQVRRAFYHTYMNIVGASKPAIRLRESIWHSIFTCDIRRYSRMLYKEMDKCATLITGSSGTGKELVARAVGWSRYIPFDSRKKQFVTDFSGSFLALNLSAFAPTLIESELFGHAHGAFNGAVERKGWLQQSDQWSTVFLDEIGELDPAIQVKLLRVLHNREFQRVGESKITQFQGKIIAATNRNLVEEMQAGRFRPDLYYRLQSDLIVTSSLYEQLQDSPEDLRKMIFFIACRVTGEEKEQGLAREAEALTEEVEEWINEHLHDYSWPGNFRELEQCVRNIMIRREYYPAQLTDQSAPGKFVGDWEKSSSGPFFEQLLQGKMTLAEVESWYSSLVYFKTGSYQKAAKQLGTDWRTLKSKVDRQWLCQFNEKTK